MPTDRPVAIYPIRMASSCCYLVKADGCLLIDTPIGAEWRRFEAALRRLPVPSAEIRLIVLTHGHEDHIGCSARARALTGAPVAMHHVDRQALADGTMIVPAGTTTLGRLLHALMARGQGTPIPLQVDLTIGDEGLSLEEYGIPGSVIHTPGHTAGSVSVLLESGDAFVGDLAMNGWPMRSGPGVPIFAADLAAVHAGWRKLLALGAHTIYPGHGRPFPAQALAA